MMPQYYVEGCHEAIIDKAVFQKVQDEIERRERIGRYSGMTVFSTKIKCGDCGGWYGPKVWHSNESCRKVIWQCNSKFKNKCTTPNFTEEEIKSAFVRMLNRLVLDRKEIIESLKELQKDIGNTVSLEIEERRLAGEMDTIASLVQNDIRENARIAYDQEEYRKRHTELEEQYRKAESLHEEVQEKMKQVTLRGREISGMIQRIEKLPGLVTEFDEAVWGALIDHVTVYGPDDLRFTLRGGREVRA